MAASEGTEKTSMLDAVVEKIRVENRVRNGRGSSRIAVLANAHKHTHTHTEASTPLHHIHFTTVSWHCRQERHWKYVAMECYAIDPHHPPHSTAHYERLFRSCRQRYQGDAPTGLLLVYPQHCVHLMEAPWDVLRTVVQDLEEMESKGYAGLVLTCLQWMNFHSLPPSLQWFSQRLEAAQL